MFRGVKAKAVHAGFPHEPVFPVLQLITHLGMLDVHVAAHQDVVVPVLAVNVVVEVRALQPVDVRATLVGMIDGREVVPVPLHRGVLAGTTGDGETRAVMQAAGYSAFVPHFVRTAPL